MKLGEKTLNVLNVIKENGGQMKTSDIQVAIGAEKIASVPGTVNSLVKNELAYREDLGKTEEGKKITNVVLTDAGMAFEQGEE